MKLMAAVIAGAAALPPLPLSLPSHPDMPTARAQLPGPPSTSALKELQQAAVKECFDGAAYTLPEQDLLEEIGVKATLPPPDPDHRAVS